MVRNAYIGEFGTEISINTGEDLTQPAVNSVAIVVKKPSGKCIEWPGVINGTNIVYDLKEGDLDEVGVWTIQSKVDSSTWKGKGRLVAFRVLRSCP